MKEKLKLTKESAREIVGGYSKDFEDVCEKITGKSRWSINYEKVAKRISDGKFFKFIYHSGATEMQDNQPYEYVDEVTVEEVFPVEKTIIVYE